MAAGRYSADRYDSRIEVLHGGTLRVTETITIRFETGSFSQFFRAMPRRLTDGIEIESASMDGTPMAIGSDPGHVQISGSSNTRVTWRFAVTAPATHTFAVTSSDIDRLRLPGSARCRTPAGIAPLRLRLLWEPAAARPAVARMVAPPARRAAARQELHE
jgi:Predicted membrane protein (DUF2207) N-terminal domain